MENWERALPRSPHNLLTSGLSTEAALCKALRLPMKEAHLLVFKHWTKGQRLAVYSGDQDWYMPPSCSPSADLQSDSISWRGASTHNWCPGFCGYSPRDTTWLPDSGGQGGLPCILIFLCVFVHMHAQSNKCMLTLPPLLWREVTRKLWISFIVFSIIFLQVSGVTIKYCVSHCYLFLQKKRKKKPCKPSQNTVV